MSTSIQIEEALTAARTVLRQLGQFIHPDDVSAAKESVRENLLTMSRTSSYWTEAMGGMQVRFAWLIF